MVRATLANRKTNTRRLLKWQPPTEVTQFQQWEVDGEFQYRASGIPLWLASTSDNSRNYEVGCRYGEIGDRLWVRETACICPKRWATPDDSCRADADGDLRYVSYKADLKNDDEEYMRDYGLSWTPSIFMPRWASRLTLEITDIRVERLQDISEEDAIAEGIERIDDCWRNYTHNPKTKTFPDAVTAWGLPVVSFQSLWESIHGEGAWEINPWVWALTFQKIEL